VTIKSAGYPARTVTTDNTGRYRLDGLPTGSFKISVVAPGFGLRASRVDVAASTLYAADFALPTGSGIITGKVRDFNKTGRPPMAATVFAYSDTYNVQNPGAELALYQTVTSSVGIYNLTNLESGSVYKIFFKAPNKRVLSLSTAAVNGTLTLPDVAL